MSRVFIYARPHGGESRLKFYILNHQVKVVCRSMEMSRILYHLYFQLKYSWFSGLDIFGCLLCFTNENEFSVCQQSQQRGPEHTLVRVKYKFRVRWHSSNYSLYTMPTIKFLHIIIRFLRCPVSTLWKKRFTINV